MSARTYTVTALEVVPQKDGFSDVATAIKFTYGNEEASLSGTCPLTEPGTPFTTLDQITEEQAMSWLLELCPNTTEEFDANLDAQIAYKANEPYEYELPSEKESVEA
jgi:hypothetical protein